MTSSSYDIWLAGVDQHFGDFKDGASLGWCGLKGFCTLARGQHIPRLEPPGGQGNVLTAEGMFDVAQISDETCEVSAARLFL